MTEMLEAVLGADQGGKARSRWQDRVLMLDNVPGQRRGSKRGAKPRVLSGRLASAKQRRQEGLMLDVGECR